jgi:hypothetical protein
VAADRVALRRAGEVKKQLAVGNWQLAAEVQAGAAVKKSADPQICANSGVSAVANR